MRLPLCRGRGQRALRKPALPARSALAPRLLPARAQSRAPWPGCAPHPRWARESGAPPCPWACPGAAGTRTGHEKRHALQKYGKWHTRAALACQLLETGARARNRRGIAKATMVAKRSAGRRDRCRRWPAGAGDQLPRVPRGQPLHASRAPARHTERSEPLSTTTMQARPVFRPRGGAPCRLAPVALGLRGGKGVHYRWEKGIARPELPGATVAVQRSREPSDRVGEGQARALHNGAGMGRQGRRLGGCRRASPGKACSKPSCRAAPMAAAAGAACRQSPPPSAWAGPRATASDLGAHRGAGAAGSRWPGAQAGLAAEARRSGQRRRAAHRAGRSALLTSKIRCSSSGCRTAGARGDKGRAGGVPWGARGTGPGCCEATLAPPALERGCCRRSGARGSRPRRR